MSSDSRWTGGAANREWQRGARVEQPVDGDAILSQVRGYLRDCKRFQGILDRRYHPAVESCLKVVFGPDRVIREAYEHLTGAARAAVPGQAPAVADAEDMRAIPGWPGD